MFRRSLSAVVLLVMCSAVSHVEAAVPGATAPTRRAPHMIAVDDNDGTASVLPIAPPTRFSPLNAIADPVDSFTVLRNVFDTPAGNFCCGRRHGFHLKDFERK